LDKPSDVFDLVGQKLNGFVSRVPDGEQASRGGWFEYQAQAFEAADALERSPEGRAFPLLPPDELARLHPELLKARPELVDNAQELFKFFQERAVEGTGPSTLMLPPFQLKDGAKPEDVSLGELGAAAIELESYEEFKLARERGDLAQDARYVACFPTPRTYLPIVLTPETVEDVLPEYERALGREFARISEEIPHEDLTIQFDVCDFVSARLEEPTPEQWTLPMELDAVPHSADSIVASLARITASVPDDVEVGMHFCYGSPGNMHVFEPRDTAAMVDFANRLHKDLGHAVAYIHMPVPKERDDLAYFEPLRNLEIGETELFLGLVHKSDGLEGGQRRVNAASEVVDSFGIATECGLTSYTKAEVPELMDLHAEIATRS
jgi:hypothetical protein